jgi:hypothetical protein
MARQIRMITFPKSTDVMIAGVAWPLSKVSALVVGLAVAGSLSGSCIGHAARCA